jgi:hypothetical protein
VSSPDKPDTARGWKFVEKLLADDTVERLEPGSDEEIERQMNAQDVQVSRVPSAEQVLARAKELVHTGKQSQESAAGAKVTAPPVRPKRTNVLVWLVAAAVGGLAIVALFQRSDHNVATGYSPPEERAAKLRDEGLAACGRQQWGECEAKLDAAKKLEASGEKDPRVVEARAAIERAARLDAGH